MHVDDFGTTSTHGAISGFGLRECVMLGHRAEYERPRLPYQMESWVIFSTLDRQGEPLIEYPFGAVAWFSDVHVTRGRSLYVTDLEGKLYMYPLSNCTGRTWVPAVSFPQGTFLHGVWSVDDDHVYIWANDATEHFLFAGSGTHWTRMIGPPFEVTIVRGDAPDHLVAGGTHGELARWDGKRWTRLPMEARTSVTGIAVVDDSMFWVTTRAGQLFEGNNKRVSERLRTPGAPLRDVAVWRNRVWLAGADDGLLRLREHGNELEDVKPNVPVFQFDSRGELLMCCPDLLAATTDAVTYLGTAAGMFAKARGAVPPHWESP
ncbi:MAG: hypothetical protein AB7T06_22315 [Kofleriaceae bacterium]